MNIDNTKFSVVSEDKENYWLEAQYNSSRGRVAIIKTDKNDSYWIKGTYESYLIDFSLNHLSITLEAVKKSKLSETLKEFDNLFHNLDNSVNNIKNLAKQ